MCLCLSVCLCVCVSECMCLYLIVCVYVSADMRTFVDFYQAYTVSVFPAELC